MLLPPDLRDWVEDNDLVHFILEVIAEIPDHQASVNPRGSGSAQYPPSAMLALLLYCYTQGIYSSRKIERATATNPHPAYGNPLPFPWARDTALSERHYS